MMDEIMEHLKSMQGYVGVNPNIPNEWKENAQKLCWEYNQTPPDWQRRAELLKQLLGTCDPLTFIEPSFRCDYGFNIHTHGLTVINYNECAWPAPVTRWTRSSGRRASVPPNPLHWRMVCGSEPTQWCAAV